MKTLFDAFQESARQFPERVALTNYHTEEQITYSALVSQINAVIQGLTRHCDLAPGDRVGLFMLNQSEWIVSFLALQALGAVVVPLNYRLSTQEHQMVMQDSGMKGLITSPDFDETYQPLLSALSWCIQTTAPDLEDSPSQACPCFSMADWVSETTNSLPPLPHLSPGDLAVLIYTSGTTGKAKGVMLSHQNLLADSWANRMVIESTQEDVFITASPLFHVFGLANVMLTALLEGASIVLVKKFNPKSILEAISKHQVTFLAAVPTMYQMMLTLLPSHQYDVSALRVCHSGAAPMPQAVFTEVETIFGAPVQEGYGQSEASSIMTSNPLKGHRKPGSVGLPLPGVFIEIVDEEGHVLPPNEIGELRAQGDTVMLGYWQNPTVTEKTIRNGWLYTSDMGYKDEEGYIFLVGRRDDLINIGGAKVYPQEVEEVLYQHETVQSCVVTAEKSDLYYQAVVAYVVPTPDKSPSATELQKFCRNFLGEFKVPKTIYFVDEIPKGPTGKILRHQLKPPVPKTSA